jgi:hypothetical protein
MIGVVKNNPALFEGINVILVGMLVKREQDISFVPGTEHFAGTNPNLKMDALRRWLREWS